MTDLRFIRSGASKTVHVLPDLEPDEDARFASGKDFAKAMTAPDLMRCGRKLYVDWAGGSSKLARPIGDFPDDDLCGGCVRAMGSNAPLIFEQLARTQREVEAARGYDTDNVLAVVGREVGR